MSDESAPSHSADEVWLDTRLPPGNVLLDELADGTRGTNCIAVVRDTQRQYASAPSYKNAALMQDQRSLAIVDPSNATSTKVRVFIDLPADVPPVIERGDILLVFHFKTTKLSSSAVLTGNVSTGKSCAIAVLDHRLDRKWTSDDDFVMSQEERDYTSMLRRWWMATNHALPVSSPTPAVHVVNANRMRMTIQPHAPRTSSEAVTLAHFIRYANDTTHNLYRDLIVQILCVLPRNDADDHVVLRCWDGTTPAVFVAPQPDIPCSADTAALPADCVDAERALMPTAEYSVVARATPRPFVDVYAFDEWVDDALELRPLDFVRLGNVHLHTRGVDSTPTISLHRATNGSYARFIRPMSVELGDSDDIIERVADMLTTLHEERAIDDEWASREGGAVERREVENVEESMTSETSDSLAHLTAHLTRDELRAVAKRIDEQLGEYADGSQRARRCSQQSASTSAAQRSPIRRAIPSTNPPRPIWTADALFAYSNVHLDHTTVCQSRARRDYVERRVNRMIAETRAMPSTTTTTPRRRLTTSRDRRTSRDRTMTVNGTPTRSGGHANKKPPTVVVRRGRSGQPINARRVITRSTAKTAANRDSVANSISNDDDLAGTSKMDDETLLARLPMRPQVNRSHFVTIMNHMYASGFLDERRTDLADFYRLARLQNDVDYPSFARLLVYWRAYDYDVEAVERAIRVNML